MLRHVETAFLWCRRCALLYRFTLFTRILLAAAFIPTGLVKALGQRFTLLPPESPIGGFFEAMYQTGGYWRFLGVCQVLAGILVLIPPLAHLGAAAFVAVVLNIFVITLSLGFHGTPVIVGLMLLAAVYLCLWDFHRFQSLLTKRPRVFELPVHRLDPWERLGFWLFGVSLIAVFLSTRDLLPRGAPPQGVPALMVLGLAGGLLAAARFGFIWIIRTRAARALGSDPGPPGPPIA